MGSPLRKMDIGSSTSGRVYYRGSGSGVSGRNKILSFTQKETVRDASNDIFAAADAAYEVLKNDPAAWKEELEERRLWEGTLGDGFEPESD